MLIHKLTGEFLEEGSQDPFAIELDLHEKKYYLGVDMGKEGAFVLIPSDRNLPIFILKMPLTKSNDVNEDFIFKYLLDWSPFLIHCITEKLKAIYQSSSRAMFNFGIVVGTTKTVLKLAKVPFTELKPTVWQREMFLGEPETLETKVRSINVAKKIFPHLKLSKFTTRKVTLKDDDNITDALLMAEFARRKNM